MTSYELDDHLTNSQLYINFDMISEVTLKKSPLKYNPIVSFDLFALITQHIIIWITSAVHTFIYSPARRPLKLNNKVLTLW